MGSSYRKTVVSLVRRSYLTQRRQMDRDFTTKIREEENIEDTSRAKAIELFERFIDRYPNDPIYTPDAMFRLGELYFERDSINFQNNMDRFVDERDRRIEKNIPLEDMVEPKKDFTPTVQLYTRLVQNFADYSRLDGVYYLIGYCLNDMGEPAKARLAWLSLVCGNKVQFRDFTVSLEGQTESGENIKDQLAESHPAMNMDAKSQSVGVGDNAVC